MNAESTPTPNYNTYIPPGVLTPDTVETPIGRLEFFDGMPDEATVQKVRDNLIFMRGVEAFLSGIPATSIEAIRVGLSDIGATRCSDVVIFESSPPPQTTQTD